MLCPGVAQGGLISKDTIIRVKMFDFQYLLQMKY